MNQNLKIVYSFLIWIVANRLFDFNLNRYTIFFQRNRNFMKFTCLTSKSTFTSIWKSSFSNIIRLMTFSRNLFSKIVSKMTSHEKKMKKKRNLKMFYIVEIIFELKLTHFATTTINKMIIEILTTCLINK